MQTEILMRHGTASKANLSFLRMAVSTRRGLYAMYIFQRYQSFFNEVLLTKPSNNANNAVFPAGRSP
jgi:hypothetical protein